MKAILTANARISDATTDHQTPSISHKSGITLTVPHWNITVLAKDITAELKPSFKAVKKPDANILKPEKTKLKANILKPCSVSAQSAASYPTKR
jgi:hypothetical protein